MSKIRFLKKRNLAPLLFSSCLAVTAAAFSNRQSETQVTYPEGYRNWTHVKTALIQKGNPAFDHWGGFHHIYANEKAVEGYKTGHFENGSVIVFDVIDAISKDSLVSEGKRKLIDVMERNTNAFKSSGGWGYEEFAQDSKTERGISPLAIKACYGCHVRKKSNDNVFSVFRN